jgi:hypothetical protein
MELFIFFTAWVLMLFAGSIIGREKGRGSTGFILVFLLGPVGLALILCLSNLKEEEKRRIKQAAFLAAQISAPPRNTSPQFDCMAGIPIPPPPGWEPNLRVASNGSDLGEIPVSEVKARLKSGELKTTDFYFDQDAADWMPLDACPKI